MYLGILNSYMFIMKSPGLLGIHLNFLSTFSRIAVAADECFCP